MWRSTHLAAKTSLVSQSPCLLTLPVRVICLFLLFLPSRYRGQFQITPGKPRRFQTSRILYLHARISIMCTLAQTVIILVLQVSDVRGQCSMNSWTFLQTWAFFEQRALASNLQGEKNLQVLAKCKYKLLQVKRGYPHLRSRKVADVVEE